MCIYHFGGVCMCVCVCGGGGGVFIYWKYYKKGSIDFNNE